MEGVTQGYIFESWEFNWGTKLLRLRALLSAFILPPPSQKDQEGWKGLVSRWILSSIFIQRAYFQSLESRCILSPWEVKWAVSPDPCWLGNEGPTSESYKRALFLTCSVQERDSLELFPRSSFFKQVFLFPSLYLLWLSLVITYPTCFWKRGGKERLTLISRVKRHSRENSYKIVEDQKHPFGGLSIIILMYRFHVLGNSSGAKKLSSQHISQPDVYGEIKVLG